MNRKKQLQPDVPPLSPLPPPHSGLPKPWRIAAIALVGSYVLFALLHLVLTPVLPYGAGSFINAPDESAHLQYVRIVAEERRLPVRGDTTYEWHQPPLYYALAAPGFRTGPRAIRLLSILFGAISLWIIYRTVRRVFPNDAVLAVTAMGFAALLPMRQAVTASVGNDALLELLFCAFVWQASGLLTNGITHRRTLTLGATIGIALLTKANGVLLVPLALVVAILLARQGEPPHALLRATAYVAVTAVAISCGLYLRNYQLYGEITPVRSFMREFEGTRKAADWIGRPVSVDIWSGSLTSGAPMSRFGYAALLVNWTFRTFWAAYTPLALAAQGIPVFLQPNYYLVYLLLTLAALAGLARLHFRRRVDFTTLQKSFVHILVALIALVGLSFAAFTWTFFQAQGRYLYPALPAISSLVALGARAILPTDWKDRGTAMLLALMFILAAAFVIQGPLAAYSGGAPRPAPKAGIGSSQRSACLLRVAPGC